MNQVLVTLGATVYGSVVKPILFRISPDTVHSFAIRTGVFIQHSSLVLATLKSVWSYSNPQRLSQHIQGVYIKNPIGLSAGFDKNIEVPAVMRAVGFGFMEGGTVTNKPYGGNPRPWFYRLPHSGSLIVHAGLANEGIDKVLHRLRVSKKNAFVDFPLNISVAHTNTQQPQSEDEMISDISETLRKVKRADVAQIITLNISCPNTYHGEVFTKPVQLEHLLTRVDALSLKQPIFLKMPCDLIWDDFDALLAVAAKHHVAGVTICNLTKSRKDVSPLDTLPAFESGGLSGKLIFEQSNKLIAQTYKSYGSQFVIIGVGGVSTAADAYKKMRLGASLVEMVTGLIYEGPQVVGTINKGIVELLKKDGFRTVKDIIGIDAA